MGSVVIIGVVVAIKIKLHLSRGRSRWGKIRDASGIKDGPGGRFTREIAPAAVGIITVIGLIGRSVIIFVGVGCRTHTGTGGVDADPEG
jgi:hypothetical protein